MPTTKQKNSPSTPVVRNRSAAIRQSHKSQAAVEDARDIALAAHSAPLAPTTQALDISRAPERGQALQLASQLERIVVVGKESHAQALELIRAGKEIKRKMTQHWQRITRSIDDLKRTMFGFRDDDMGSLDRALASAEQIVLTWENAERRRHEEAEQARRAEAERQAREQRQRDLDAAEDRALELEQQSTNLSARELWFVTEYVKLCPTAFDTPNPSVLANICKQAGFKDPVSSVQRLLGSSKVLDAIKGQREAIAIREQAAAQRQQPLDVAPIAPVDSNLASGRGLPTSRTYYRCEVVDANKLREAYINGEVSIDALVPNETYLNGQARSAKSAEIFERAFPGCRLVKRQGLAG